MPQSLPLASSRSIWSRLSFFLCIAMAIIAEISLYPGWLFYDSAKQWEWARQIAESGMPAQLQDYLISAHWPFFDTLIKVPFYKLSGEAGLYGAAQAIFFNLGIYLLGCALLGRRSPWLLACTAFMVLSPVAVNYSIFHSSDTVVAGCALISVAMICDGGLGLALRIGALAGCTLLMSLVRYNALPAAFLLLVVFFWLERATLGKLRSIALCGASVALIAGGVALMHSYQQTAIKSNPVAGSIALRLLDASHETADPVIHAITDPNVRANPRLREPLDPACYAHGMWCHQFSVPWRRVSTDGYLSAYFHLLVRHPLVFTEVTAHFASYTLGFAAPLEPTQIGRTDVDAPFPSARMIYNHRRRASLKALHSELRALDGFVARTGAVFLVGFAAAFAVQRFRIVLALSALAIGYLGPLVLLAGTNNFRYTLPVSIVAMTIIAGSCCVLLDRVQAGLRKRFAPA